VLPSFDSLGKTVMVAGAILFVVGVIIYFSDKIPWLGRLPGDIRIERQSFGFYFPIATSLLLSIVLTILINLFSRR